MLELDLLPVESGEKSGDAIALRFHDGNRWIIIVIDGGYADVARLSLPIFAFTTQPTNVDLVVSTHPDSDHINGLTPVIEQMNVTELWIHRPWLHRQQTDAWGVENARDLVALAQRRGVAVSEPFTGLNRFNAALVVAGPTQDYYEELLDAAITGAIATAAQKGVLSAARTALRTS